MFFGKTSWTILRTCLIVSLILVCVRVVLDVSDVSPCGSDWEFVEPQSFSFSKKRAHCGTDTQEETRYEGLPVKAPLF